MTDLTKIERFAQIKSQMKTLKAEADQLQYEIIEDGAPEKIKTTFGTLTLANRETWECNGNEDLWEAVGKDLFLASAKVTPAAFKKAAGQVRYEMVMSQGHFYLKSTSQYYTLRK